MVMQLQIFFVGSNFVFEFKIYELNLDFLEAKFKVTVVPAKHY
jgi:hypothetical protein